jgi:hypothetical protein
MIAIPQRDVKPAEPDVRNSGDGLSAPTVCSQMDWLRIVQELEEGLS